MAADDLASAQQALLSVEKHDTDPDQVGMPTHALE
jgi:hypothetical protein